MPYIEPSAVESAKRIDLFSYLRECDPDELVRISASTYATKTHDSLKISNGKWFWWSQGFGGRSALDYLIKVRDVSKRLGHAKVSITLDIYSHMMPGQDRAIADKLSDLFSSDTPPEPAPAPTTCESRVPSVYQT